MAFNTRSEFINAQASEKVTLVHMHATSRLYNFTLHSGNVYKKVVPYYVVGVKENNTLLGAGGSIGSVGQGEWYYNPYDSTLYVWTTTDVDPSTIELIVTYRFFYSTLPTALPWNLSVGMYQVQYEGRITSAPGYSHEVGIDQALVSTVGSGTLKLENTDGGLDSFFDVLFFENQEVSIYSWARTLPISEAKIIYRGRVTNKTYSSDTVTFTVKDKIYDLLQHVPQTAYDDSDAVATNVRGRYKRWVYGRVDGLQLQSTSQIGEGYALTGTVTGDATTTLTGTGTAFLSECSPNDRLTIASQEFTIESIQSDTSLTLNDPPDYTFAGQTAYIVPEIPVTTKNREFFVTDHAGARLTSTVVNALQLNRVELSSTEGLGTGDYITFQDTAERIPIKNVAPGNIVVLYKNMVSLPAVGSNVTREPVQSVYVEGAKVPSEKYTISNLGAPTNELKVTLAADVEYDLANPKPLPATFTFTNGVRGISYAGSLDITTLVKPRDWVKPDDITYTTYYEVLQVTQTEVTLRTPFANPTIVDTMRIISPNYISDDTIISADVIGRTENGEPSGTWIQSASQTIKDLVTVIGITDINTASFTAGNDIQPQLISLALPETPRTETKPVKDVIDIIAKSVLCAVTLDNDLKLQYIPMIVRVPDIVTEIDDFDVISWDVRSTNGKTYKDVTVNYRFTDVDRVTLEDGNSTVTGNSVFVDRYIGTAKRLDLDSRIYNTVDAEVLAHRSLYFNRLGTSTLTVVSDLRLEGLNLGDTVKLNFRRLYKRFGDPASTLKLGMIVGKKVNGEEIEFQISDLGNTFNASSIITPNTAPTFAASTSDDKLKYGYITDNQGISSNLDETANTNLIS